MCCTSGFNELRKETNVKLKIDLSFNSYHIATFLICVWCYLTDIPSGNAVDLCFKIVCFESQPKYCLTRLRFSFVLRGISCKIQEHYITSFGFWSVEY
jgi:hypothetical protein